ncbi:HAD family hydrolase [Cytobacillus firmus]|uniref:HAD family hydrolase n=1 Tax=Cytobacillus firmus TaxID=1399 RepID=UPI00368AFE0F
MIRAILFDFDGTLLDRDKSLKIFIESQYERLNKWVSHIPKELFISRFIELDNRGYVWKDQVYQQLIKEFGITELTWEDLLEDYLLHFKKHCVPFPGLKSMLADLKSKGYLLGIVTNGKGQFQMNNIKALGIAKYFDSILISEWEGLKKPDPQIFKRALEQLELIACESIYIGDHPENDVNAARKVGMKGIWKRDLHWNNVEADIIIDGLEEIPLGIQRIKNP